MSNIRTDHKGEADPTMDQLHDSLLKAKFEESEGEAFMSKRLKRIMDEKYSYLKHNKNVRQAFIAGYKEGADRDILLYIMGLMGCFFLIVFVLQALYEAFA